MNVHIIEEGRVVNTVVVDSLDDASMIFPDAVVLDASLTPGSVGDIYDEQTGTLTRPAAAPVAVPEAVTMRQARLALLAAGKLETVQTTIAGLTGEVGDRARIEWEFSSEVRRRQPLVIDLMPALGLTEQQLDELFIQAATL
jgi:hypothetical protein